MKHTARFISIVLYLLSMPFLYAQKEAIRQTSRYPDEPQQIVPFSLDEWKKATKHIPKDPPVTAPDATSSTLPQTPEPQKALPSLSTFNKTLLQVVWIGVLGILIIFLLRALLKRSANPSIAPSSLDARVENLDIFSPQEALDTLLAQAIREKAYRAAVRIYFLRTLQVLQEGHYIRWKKEKTNQDYLYELQGTIVEADFRQLCWWFDFVRYGARTPDEAEFDTISHLFRGLIQTLTTKTTPDVQ